MNRKHLGALVMLACFGGLAWTLGSFIGINEPNILTPLNLLPAVFVWLLFIGLTRRLAASLVLTMALLALLILASQIKAENLKVPLLATDFIILKTVSLQESVLGKYVTLELLTLMIVLFLGLALLIRLEPPLKALRGKYLAPYWAFLVLGVALPAASLTEGYYREGATWLKWDPVSNVKTNGLLAVLVMDWMSLDLETPIADTRVIEDFVASQPALFVGEGDGSDIQPNIIVLLLESFFDPSIIVGVNDCEYLPKWCDLRQSAVWGALEVPTYGGNTNRTEFEILTGISLDSYPNHVFPYFSLVTKSLESYPHYLKSHGYQTTAIHPHKGEFWNRTTVYPLMNIDEFLAIEQFKGGRRDGWYIADSEIPPKIETILGRDSPQFNLTITMENHGPWGKRKNIDEEELQALPAFPGLSEQAQRQWLEYLYHLKHSEQLVIDVVEMINKTAEPTIVLAFGDHLPSLPSVFAEVAFKDGEPPERQSAPYVIFDNFSGAGGRELDASADLIMSEVLKLSGLPMRSFDRVSHYFLQNFDAGDWSAADRELLSAFQIMQFNKEITTQVH